MWFWASPKPQQEQPQEQQQQEQQQDEMQPQEEHIIDNIIINNINNNNSNLMADQDELKSQDAPTPYGRPRAAALKARRKIKESSRSDRNKSPYARPVSSTPRRRPAASVAALMGSADTEHTTSVNASVKKPSGLMAMDNDDDDDEDIKNTVRNHVCVNFYYFVIM